MSAKTDDFKRQVLRLAGGYLVVAISVLMALGWPLYENYVRSREEVIEAKEQGYLSIANHMVRKEFLEVAGDVGVISTSAVLSDFLNEPSASHHQRLTIALEQIAHNYSRYVDLQVQDLQGHVLVRVQRAELAEQNRLPSITSLLVAHSATTLRISTPVFNGRQKKAGILQLDFQISELLDAFANVMVRNPFHHAMLVGSTGEWLSPGASLIDSTERWSKDSFAQQYPKAWQSISQRPSGTVQTAQGMFLFDTIYPLELDVSPFPQAATLQHQGVRAMLEQPRTFYWKAIILVPSESLEEPSFLWRSHGAFGGGLFVVLVLVSGMLAERKVHSNVERAREHQNAQEIAALYDQAPCGYHSLDTHGRIIRMNLTELTWLGYEHNEVQNCLHLTDLLAPASAEHFKKLFTKLKVTGSLHDVSLEMVRKDGSILPVLLNATAEMSPQGEFLSCRTVCIDMTEIQRLQKALEHKANTDGLTSLCNRRHFFELGERELSRATRDHRPVSVCMLDIDHFKQVNDTYGHAVGDKVLVTLAQILAPQLRNTDVLSRLGGEEFAVLLPDTSLQMAQEIAERLRIALAEATVVLDAGRVLHFTVSIGVALHSPSAASLEQMLCCADIALYEAKTGGRNRVCIAPLQPVSSPEHTLLMMPLQSSKLSKHTNCT